MLKFLRDAVLVLALLAAAGAQAQEQNDLQRLSAGTVFRDCADCPEMVAIPPGSFMMGSPESEPQRMGTEDCYNRSYDGAPVDGSAWTSGLCALRVLRGGSWNGHPGFARSAFRGRFSIDGRLNYFGFRIARTN